MIKFGMLVAGMKKYVEKTIERNNYNHKPADIPKSLKKKAEISETILLDNKVFTLIPKVNSSNKVILYLHGGAYIEGISKIHWDLIEELMQKTNATIVVADYPLTPNATYSDVYAFIDEVYSQLLSEYSNDNIIIMGDSAGGGLALGFVQKLRNEGSVLPNQLILISPWLDITMSNPEIQEIDKKDKMLNVRGLKLAAELYADNLEHDNYLVSPNYGTFQGLPKISVFTGTYDILNPDANKLKEIVSATDTKLNFFEYPKMFHVWVLITSLKESQSAINQIVKLILE
ncbi:MAG: alpha/beta hydrolase [Desulfobulbaceae bacterium]|nr:alpha/beta hydrolase [Desulfobulbaceae bacterium]